ncbi:transmembrane protein 272-like isoform X2 [Siniperca chuatsi]|nr:transmembrane protein 272-like isoform X2 [Siniperca chuatsi]
MLIAQGVVGAVYIHDCPLLPFIPFYLLVMGGSILLFCLIDCNVICFGSVFIFYFFWFFAGNVCIYAIYPLLPSYDKNTTQDYCNKTLYLFAFWTTNMTYVVFGVIFLSWCCCEQQESDDAQMPVQV